MITKDIENRWLEIKAEKKCKMRTSSISSSCKIRLNICTQIFLLICYTNVNI